MSNFTKSLLGLVLIVGILLGVYAVFLRPLVFSWGATESEVKMPMVGDEIAPSINSTRAINIKASKAEVWKWLTQLGADRGGFFSYAFIEAALGYEYRQGPPGPDDQLMKVGRIVPASLDASKSLIEFSWPLVAVAPGKSFVLKGWGAFLLEQTSGGETRLIVRSHGRETPDLLSKLIDFFGKPAHHIMERRMLMGFKARAETGLAPSSVADNLWLLGLVLSLIGIVFFIFWARGFLSFFLPVAYGILWLHSLLIFDPEPVYSLGLFALVSLKILWLNMKKRRSLS